MLFNQTTQLLDTLMTKDFDDFQKRLNGSHLFLVQKQISQFKAFVHELIDLFIDALIQLFSTQEERDTIQNCEERNSEDITFSKMFIQKS